MTARVTVRRVRFKRSFRLFGIAGVHPPGEYDVTVREERADNTIVQAWQHIWTTIAIPHGSTVQDRRIDPVDLAASQSRDQEPSVPQPARFETAGQ